MSDKNIQAIYPLTSLQEGILYHCISAPESPVYVTQYSCQIDGEINLDYVQETWRLLVARHSALRTLFTWQKRDRPLQIVRREVELPYSVADLRAANHVAKSEKLEEFLQRDRENGFDLDVAPLMRLKVLRLDDNRIHVVWTFHHIILDGWSRQILFGEFIEVYRTLLLGNEPDHSPAPAYEEFVTWQQQQDVDLAKQFWKQRLDAFSSPSTPEVPLIDEKDDEPLAPGKFTMRRMEKSLSKDVRKLAKQGRHTLNTVIVSAWAILLSRYCNSSDVVFGTTVSGRSANVDGIEHMAGLFINTLPVRIRLAVGETLSNLLDQVQSQQSSLREFEQTSLQVVRNECDVPGTKPLFETILVFENLPEVSPGHGGQISISNERVNEFSNFPLALIVVPEEEIQLIAVHDTRRYSKPAVEGFLRGLEHILGELVTDARHDLSTITAVSEVDQTRILSAWNKTNQSYYDRSITSVSELIERRAAEVPESPAITTNEECISYDELNRRANKLARALRRHSNVRGRPIIVFAERSIAAIVSMVAALKAGAVYVSTDATDTSSRLASVVKDLTSAFSNGQENYKPLLLTQAHLQRETFESIADVLLIDADQIALDDSNIDEPRAPDDLAYIIYTSGSTGQPKGVMVQHHALLNSTIAREAFYTEPPCVFALLSSLGTDSSIAGIYWTLCFGGNLVLPGRKTELDIVQLVQLFNDHGVTHTLCVPSLYALILENCERNSLSSLRTVIVAGEASNARLAAAHHNKMPATHLYNEYGPSEACVWACAYRIEGLSVLIGRPIANTQLYVLDADRRPVPVGVAGELYIGGANVALGYLGKEEATAAVFIADPYSEKPQRMYKTGDRVRYLLDGNLEFLGRVDDQIKIRGYRVEPGEIEAKLTRHPNVEAAVVFVEQVSLDKELDSLIESTELSALEEILQGIESMDEQAVDRVLSGLDGSLAEVEL